MTTSQLDATAQLDATVAQIKAAGLIAIVRGDFSLSQLLAIADTLQAAGIMLMEVTLNTPNALEAIAQLSRQQENRMLIGAGTVRTVQQVEQAAAAGARFTIAPNFDPQSAARAHALGLLHLPGVFTATEAQTAHAAGCRLLKLFPADALGPGYLKALRAPLNDIDFVPTGGINAETLPAYHQAGAAAFGIGSALVRGPGQSLDELHHRAQALHRVWRATQLR